jgi:phage baseplate assembly protein W
MADRDQRFGADLRLLRNLDHQEDRNRGADLITRTRAGSGETDLEVLADVSNLKQALLLRFLTHTGELAVLGHPDYGSRLHLLIGELNTEATRNRAKLYVLEALQAEPRVKEILSVDVVAIRRDRTRVDIDVNLRTIVSDTPVNLVFPFFLEESAPS